MLRQILCGVQRINGGRIPQCSNTCRELFPPGMSSYRLFSSEEDENSSDRMKKIINVELTYKQEEGQPVPGVDFLKPDDMELLVDMSSTQRNKYYGYLYKNQNHHNNEMMKREIRKMMTEVNAVRRVEEKSKNTHIIYGLGHNTLLPKIYNRTIDKWRNLKVFRNLLLGSQLIFDCGYEGNMTHHEIKNTANQLCYAFGRNRDHRRPFYFYFSNINQNGPLYGQLMRNLPTIGRPGFPITVTDQLYPAEIPKEKLVYLTPDSTSPLLQFSHDDTYIVGGIVDRGEERPLGLARAKEHGIRTARLPLERMSSRFTQSKCLTIDQIVRIMLELKTHGNLDKAQKWIPARKQQQ